MVGRQEAEASIGQRGPEQVPAEILEALAVVTAHLGRRFEVESATMLRAFDSSGQTGSAFAILED